MTCLCSIDSAQERALEAEARLKDYGEPVVPRKQDGAAASLLPGAAAVFDEVCPLLAGRASHAVAAEGSKTLESCFIHQEPAVSAARRTAACEGRAVPACSCPQVDGPPSFLDPEAIRPLAMSSAHMGGGLLIGAGESSTGDEGPDKSRIPGKDFDISRLAPLLKGQKR
jgi:hypothetical protein